MSGNLVIVESPAKAKTIERFLGEDFKVVSSFGHIRDLSKKNIGIDIENGFSPEYIIPADKKKIVAELKKQVKESKLVWLASDEDREGEAIAWHLMEVLKLNEENTRRIVFHEITREAIKNAIDNPRTVNCDVVNAQQARRVLDRLVGFQISPILWRKVQPALSAGRVQSVALRLLVEREREIISFKPESSFRVQSDFTFTGDDGGVHHLKAETNKKFSTEGDAKDFLELCAGAGFTINDVTVKPGSKSPAPPFTTSTLQQEAYRKLGFSVAQTMSVAQKLYEAGKITYMRTDSTNLSQLAINTAASVIKNEYGEAYSKARQFRTKSKGAQEAHEAIRPTYMDNREVPGSRQEKRLYDLIWKRTLASQMSNARVEKTSITIGLSNSSTSFFAHGEVITFDGFLKVYRESTDNGSDEAASIIPPVRPGLQLSYESISATERFTTPLPRYTEASLVKKMEELGIGRPSTYAPVISTIQQRGYVAREDRPGTKRKIRLLSLKAGKIEEAVKSEMAGSEKAKLFPQDIGMIVNDFLVENFKDIFDYHFTANVEVQFDRIAEGKLPWTKMLEEFYSPFHRKVEDTLEQSTRKTGVRILGDHPETGEQVSVRMGRFGPFAQVGGAGDDDRKPLYASLRKGQLLETISLEEVLELFRLPREIGEYEGKVLSVGVGRFGPFVKHDNKFFSLVKNVDDPLEITRERAIELIEAKREGDKKKVINTFGEISVLNGRYGPYISYKKKNYKIPKKTDPATLTEEDCLKLIEKGSGSKK